MIDLMSKQETRNSCTSSSFFSINTSDSLPFFFFFFLMIRPPPRSTPFPYPALFRSKAASGPVILKLADNALVVARIKASAADIKAGDYVATGGVPQPDGTQKAVELRIFPESMRGNGEGHRPGWPGAPNGTMTNGGVGQTVSSVDGPVLTVKLKDGDKKIIVGPNVPVQRLVVSDRNELKAGGARAAAPAAQQTDRTLPPPPPQC